MIGPALGAFAAGQLETAFDTFLRGVGGDGYRAVLEAQLGHEGYARAVRESAFFFRDELPAVREWQFGPAEAGRIRQPVLLVEGGESARHSPLSGQITARGRTLLPQAEVVTIAGTNHLLPLQDPDAVGHAIATFAQQHPLMT